jgi:hypothetical protein
MNTVISKLFGSNSITTEAILADEVFYGLNTNQAIEKVKSLIPRFLLAKNDKGLMDVLALAGLFFQSRQDKENNSEAEKTQAEFLDFLQATYFSLPDKPETLPQTRVHIVQTIGGMWDARMCAVSRKAFSFLCAVYSTAFKWDDDPSPEEQLMKHRDTFHEERKVIDAIIREKLGNSKAFTPEIIQKWLKKYPRQSKIPAELIKIFEINWIRNGGKMGDFLLLKDAVGDNLPEWSYRVLGNVAAELRAMERFKNNLLEVENELVPNVCRTWGAPILRFRVNKPGHLLLSIVFNQAPTPADKEGICKDVSSLLVRASYQTYVPRFPISVTLAARRSTKDPIGGCFARLEISKDARPSGSSV